LSGTPPYVELHCRSAYSFGHGASQPQELLERASDLGSQALALTDHDSVSGAMEFAMAARDSPVRAILGSEITRATRAHARRPGDVPTNGPRALAAEAREPTSTSRLRSGWWSVHTQVYLDHGRSQVPFFLSDLGRWVPGRPLTDFALARRSAL
jgi:hypothetical protein